MADILFLRKFQNFSFGWDFFAKFAVDITMIRTYKTYYLFFINCQIRLFIKLLKQEKMTVLHWWQGAEAWLVQLTHWGRVTHICIGKLIIIGSDNGLSPDRRQAIIWTNAGLLSIGPLRTHFSDNLFKFKNFHWRKCIWICRLRNGVHFVSASMF